MYNSKEAAEYLNLDFRTINKYCRTGIIKNAYKEGRSWCISKESVEEYKQEYLVNKDEELLGERFGDLTILEILGYKPEGNGTQQRLFVLAGCECGNKVEKAFYSIERGSIKRCGRDCILNSGFNIGDKYGLLTIIGNEGIKEVGNQIKRKKRKRHVKVVCDCGKERVVELAKLKIGHYNACSKACELYLRNLVNKKFSCLTVLKEVNRNHRNDRMFLCKCDCGIEKEKEYWKLVSGHTKYCGHGCELKKGEGSPTWNPDITMEERLRGRDYWEYKQWRTKVYVRDKYKCQLCGTKGDINAHHLDGYNWCKEKRTDVSNGITLDQACHKKFHETYGYGNNTKEQFEEWLESMESTLHITETECKVTMKEKTSIL